MKESDVLEIIAERLSVTTEDISVDTVIAEMGIDSLDLLDVLSTLEQEYEIEFDNNNIEQLATIGDVVDYIKRELEN